MNDLSFEKFPEFLEARKGMLRERFAAAVEMVADAEVQDATSEKKKSILDDELFRGEEFFVPPPESEEEDAHES